MNLKNPITILAKNNNDYFSWIVWKQGEGETTSYTSTSYKWEPISLDSKIGSRQGCPSGACKKQKELSILLQCHEFSIQETKSIFCYQLKEDN
jgi:hypothetical protein